MQPANSDQEMESGPSAGNSSPQVSVQDKFEEVFKFLQGWRRKEIGTMLRHPLAPPVPDVLYTPSMERLKTGVRELYRILDESLGNHECLLELKPKIFLDEVIPNKYGLLFEFSTEEFYKFGTPWTVQQVKEYIVMVKEGLWGLEEHLRPEDFQFRIQGSWEERRFSFSTQPERLFDLFEEVTEGYNASFDILEEIRIHFCTNPDFDIPQIPIELPVLQ